jgi:hypothetical protein
VVVEVDIEIVPQVGKVEMVDLVAEEQQPRPLIQLLDQTLLLEDQETLHHHHHHKVILVVQEIQDLDLEIP